MIVNKQEKLGELTKKKMGELSLSSENAGEEGIVVEEVKIPVTTEVERTTVVGDLFEAVGGAMIGIAKTAKGMVMGGEEHEPEK